MSEPDVDRIRAAKDAIQRAAQEYAEASHPDHEGVYVQAWAIGLEWTSVELERTNRGGLHAFSPDGQMLAASRGLGEYVADRYSGWGDDE